MSSLCPNCGESDWKTLYSAQDFDTGQTSYRIGRCKECQITATINVSPESLSEAYSNKYYGSSTEKFSHFAETLLTISSHHQANVILKQWRLGCGNKEVPKVLDIGCGRGTLLRAFQSKGADVLGLERAEFPLDEDNEQFIRIASITDSEFDAVKFDIVIIWHVLEHVTKIDEMIMSVKEHLNDGALMVIAVPNFDSIQQHLFTRHWFHLDIPRHLFHFDRAWLKSRLNDNDFKIVKIKTFDLIQNVYGFIQSALNMLFSGRPNTLYRLIKYKAGGTSATRLIAWVLPILLTIPFAIFETIVSAATGKGASLIIYARNDSNHDKQ